MNKKLTLAQALLLVAILRKETIDTVAEQNNIDFLQASLWWDESKKKWQPLINSKLEVTHTGIDFAVEALQNME